MKDFKELITTCILGAIVILIIFWFARGGFSGIPDVDANHEYQVASSIQASLHE